VTGRDQRQKGAKAHIWIISEGQEVKADSPHLDNEGGPYPVKVYQISDLAKYMLSPKPIQVKKTLVGCEIHRFPTLREKIGKAGRRVFLGKAEDDCRELVISDSAFPLHALNDSNLRAHMERVFELLKPYNPVIKKLSKLDFSGVEDVIGLCEDVTGTRSWLRLQGNVEEKSLYVAKYLFADVQVLLDSAYVTDGLFEMAGFQFESYDARNVHTLLKFSQSGECKYCVVSLESGLEYWVKEPELIKFIQLLQHSVSTSPHFAESISSCVRGRAKASKILFNRDLSIDYSKRRLPEIYRKVFETWDMELSQRDVVIDSLKNEQLGISFNYVPTSKSGAEELHTDISVMHNVRALEPLRKTLPLLYSEIDKKATESDGGKYYLLDSIGGYRNA
jgi:hypothetical protein